VQGHKQGIVIFKLFTCNIHIYPSYRAIFLDKFDSNRVECFRLDNQSLIKKHLIKLLFAIKVDFHLCPPSKFMDDQFTNNCKLNVLC
jgi:hypothetical protein